MTSIGPSAIRVAALLLVLTSCAQSTAPAAPVEPTPTPLPIRMPPPEPRRYTEIEEIAAAIGCTDVEDLGNGGNAGLRTQGICYVGRHNIDIYLTTERALWEHVAAQFTSVTGPNWIVVCPTGEEAARYVAGMIGGEVNVAAAP